RDGLAASSGDRVHRGDALVDRTLCHRRRVQRTAPGPRHARLHAEPVESAVVSPQSAGAPPPHGQGSGRRDRAHRLAHVHGGDPVYRRRPRGRRHLVHEPEREADHDLRRRLHDRPNFLAHRTRLLPQASRIYRVRDRALPWRQAAPAELPHPGRGDDRALAAPRAYRETPVRGQHARVDDRYLHRIRRGVRCPHGRGYVHARAGHGSLPAVVRPSDAPVQRAEHMIRPHTDSTFQGLIGRIKRRQLLRLGFLTGTLLAVTEITALTVPFIKVNKILGLGVKLAVGSKDSVFAQFKSTNDTPILNIEGKFFLIHAPGGLIAAYRKCTHLGCSVPWNAAEDQFHCPCHGSLYDKHTAVVKGGPAPKPLQLFHIITDASGTLIVDTNPLNVIDRQANVWDPKVLEITE